VSGMDRILREELEDWDRNAGFYEAELSMPYQQIIQSRISRFYSIPKGASVLDIGSGVQDGKDKVCLDISLEMIRRTKKRNPESRGVVGCAQSLPFKKESFDAVVCNGVLHHLKVQRGLQASMAGFHHILKPRGKLYAFDRAPSVLPLLLFYLRKPGKIFIKPRSTCSTRNEVAFLESDVRKITALGFRVIRRRYLVNILFQHMIMFMNLLSYLGMRRLSRRLQRMTGKVAMLTERVLAVKPLCAEQCLVLQKK